MAPDDPDGRDRLPEEAGPRAAPYPMSRLAPRYDLVDAAKEIERADAAIGVVVGAKLEAIVEQIRFLQEQARGIVEQARASVELHRAACAFRKVPGRIYHLYERSDGPRYFSLLSPDDWNGAPPHRFVGSYRLEADMTWTSIEDLGRRDALESAAVGLLARGRDGTQR